MTPRKTQRKNTVHPSQNPQAAHLATPPTYSRAWMPVWIEAAARTGQILTACEEAKVSLGEYHDGRISDLAFDEACRVHDKLVDLRITESLRIGAMDGDIRAQGLYFSRVRDLVFPPASPSEHGDAILSPTVAEAMIRAGLATAVAAASVSRSSRPKRKPITKSELAPTLDEIADADPVDLPPLPH